METKGLDPLEALAYIDPAELDYQDWLAVGMGLKEAGCPAAAWDEWSRRDAARYHPGECERKYRTFRRSDITAGTVIKMALDRGWRPAGEPSGTGRALDWDDIIFERGADTVVDKNWIEGKDVEEPEEWRPAEELIRYLQTVFEPEDIVGYVTRSFEKDGQRFPSKGCWDRSAGKLIEGLRHCGDDIGAVLGDYSEETGAWIRFNPLDGKGVKNENVAAFRYALVESDTLPIAEQNAMIRELELPVAALVHSGGKSLHAVVRIEADSYEEYRRRVDFLYSVCQKNGLQLDRQNRNPSRLSRMPGATRDGRKQFLVDTNIGKASWQEWREWIESVTDDLPDQETLSDIWDSLPPLAPPLIDGILRQGHKMLLAGPSKAGKSFALIELSICIAEGLPWMDFPCAKGRVMYVNLELDRATCLHRFRDVYEGMGREPKNLAKIDVWNLRGHAVPMDKLAPKLIRRAKKKDYIAIIIDPIYKVITGDENSADQMANFCNQFDKVCNELGCAVIYCHHHSKGSQGGKRSMDRASGSGVFARDPDALLDLIELPVSEELRAQQVNRAVGRVYAEALENAGKLDDASQDDLLTEKAAQEAARGLLSARQYEDAVKAASAAKKTVEALTAWRIEGTLREFPKFPPVNLWFDYPVHRRDESGALGDVDPEAAAPPWRKAADKHKAATKKARRSKAEEFEDAVNNCNMGDPPTVKDLQEWFSSTGKEVPERTIRDWVKKFGYVIDRNNGNTVKKDAAEN